MTVSQRKTRRNTLLIAIAALILIKIFMQWFKEKQEEEGKEPLPVWSIVESVVTVITAALVVWLLLMIAPLLPFSPILIYVAAIGVALYGLYYGFMRFGSKDSIIPDDFYDNLNPENVFTNKKDESPPWFKPNYQYDA